MAKTNSKDIYKWIITRKIQTPTSLEKWIIIYPFLENNDWAKIYMIPYRCIVEPSLQSFQYKIINRLLNCNENLCKWKIKNSDKCFYCLKVDTIEHHLFECTESKKNWVKLNKWMLNNFEFVSTSLFVRYCLEFLLLIMI